MALGVGSLLVAGALGDTVEARPRVTPLPAGTGRGRPFSEGWRFHRGDGSGFEVAGFDDAHWRRIDLPHDWSIEDVPGGQAPDQLGPFDRNSLGAGPVGYTLGGVGWYRKHFNLGELAAGSRVEIVFDGVYAECEIWLNGVSLGRHLNGYAPFARDLTPHLISGENVIAVQVRNEGKNTRWYAGSGIYQQVWLDVTPPGTRVARWGVAGWTKRIARGAAEIEVTTTLDDAKDEGVLVTRLRDAAGRIVAEASAPLASAVRQVLTVRGARLWSPADPYLHMLESEVRQGERVTDRVSQTFGIRIIAMDTRQGLTINGERLIVRGGNLHHDNGLLGACAYPQADDRRIKLLKERGYNAVRSSHNPMPATLLDACDRHGILVMNEAFDMWHVGKNPQDYSRYLATDWQNVIEAMVLSSRNRASVFMWSIGNEIPDRSSPEGIKWEWTFANAVRTLDPTRPVTAGLNGLLGPVVRVGETTARAGHAGESDNAAAIFLDVAGYNYRLDRYEPDHAEVSSRLMIGTETYPNEAWDFVLLTERAPYVLGEFVWTAMDYIGEAAIGSVGYVAKDAPLSDPAAWPCVISGCGDLDLIGHRKVPSRFRDVAWGLSAIEMAVHRPVPEGKVERVSKWGWPDVVQSWNWSGDEGKVKEVHLYTRGDRVVLSLDGRKVGEVELRPEDKLRTTVLVPFAAGVLEAVAYRLGREIGRSRLDTTGVPARLRVRPEVSNMGSGRMDLGYVAVDVLDAQGRIVPDATNEIELTIAGRVELAGFGSGNLLATGSYQQPSARAFQGRAMAILRGQNMTGTVRITARAEGLESGSAPIRLG